MENESVKSRLKEFARFKGLPIYKFESLCGMSQGYVSNIRQSISPNFVQKITSIFPDLNVSWLITGNGEMILRDNYGTVTGQIRDGSDTASGDESVQNISGNNNQIGIPPKKFESEKDWFALVAEKDKQIDRLLTIIETITNTSK